MQFAIALPPVTRRGSRCQTFLAERKPERFCHGFLFFRYLGGSRREACWPNPVNGVRDGRRSVHLVMALVALFILSPAVAVPAHGEEEGKAIELLSRQTKNGQLPGWQAFHEGEQAEVGDVWALKDGVLSCRGTPKGYIRTQKDFGSFILELDWRLPKREGPLNGGVLIRMTGPDQIWPKSLEAQINSGAAGDFWGLAGYELSDPQGSTVTHPELGKLTHLKRTADAEKPPGTWNHYKIVADGSTVTLEINGRVVNRATDCETTPGGICLTAEGNRIEFRNVRLVPLEE